MRKLTADGLQIEVSGLIRHFSPEIEHRIAERGGGAGELLEAAE